MMRRYWRAGLLGLILLLSALVLLRLCLAGGEDPDPAPQEDLRAYLPPLVGTTFHFQGSGMEYASFRRRITFASGDLLQMEDLSGTNLAQVVERSPQELAVIYAEEEFYAEQSLLGKEARQGRELGRSLKLILLKGPLEIGNTWSDDQFQREIVAVKQVVEVPLGTFYDVVVVKSRSRAADSVHYEYYAKNVGLIKREFVLQLEGGTYQIVSSLEAVSSVGSQ